MTSPQPPNIVFIIIDDLGWKDLSCYGSSFYETPHIDRLAAEGMRFDNAYAASPVCSPSRASILTGKYPAKIGLTNFIGGVEAKGRVLDAPCATGLPSTEYTIAHALQAAGYQTFSIGKWHLGDCTPCDFGFDINIAGSSWGLPRNGYFSPYRMPNLKDGPRGEYLTDRLTSEAIRLIDARSPDHPFFMYLSHYAVHIPIQVDTAYTDYFTRKAHFMGLDTERATEMGEHFSCEHKKDKRVVRRVVQSNPKYAGMLKNLDDNIGRLLESIERGPHAGNTLVIFTSDNGGLATAEGSPTCNLPLIEGKGWTYEGGTRVPLIAWWPGKIKPNSVCSVPVCSPDFYNTFLDLSGSGEIDHSPEQLRDGVSLKSLFEGSNKLDRQAIFWHYPHYGNQGGTPASSMRSGDYKLIEFFEDGRLELYDLSDDIGEQHNLAASQPERASAMQAQLAAWRVSIEAKIPQPNRAAGD